MLKKNLSIILVVLLTILLMAIVIWIFNRRIEKIGMTNKANSYILFRKYPVVMDTFRSKV